jgi:23S rRNA (pseudouridine1915-N3)-methyltransferase
LTKSPLHLFFPFLGKTKQDYLASGVEDYKSRLNRFARLTVRILREKHYSVKVPVATVMREEGRLLLDQVPPGAVVVALAPAGRDLTSEELATMLAKWEEQGKKEICFLIGGANGLAPEVLARADILLSLSRMTFTHEMARFILLEQVYRAFTIRAKTGYHK